MKNTPNHRFEADGLPFRYAPGQAAAQAERWGEKAEVEQMKEQTIIEVAAILSEWNPLGARADDIADLADYRAEAIDIVSAIAVFGNSKAPNKLVAEVLSQSFELNLLPSECESAAKKIMAVITGAQ